MNYKSLSHSRTHARTYSLYFISLLSFPCTPPKFFLSPSVSPPPLSLSQTKVRGSFTAHYTVSLPLCQSCDCRSLSVVPPQRALTIASNMSARPSLLACTFYRAITLQTVQSSVSKKKLIRVNKIQYNEHCFMHTLISLISVTGR